MRGQPDRESSKRGGEKKNSRMYYGLFRGRLVLVLAQSRKVQDLVYYLQGGWTSKSRGLSRRGVPKRGRSFRFMILLLLGQSRLPDQLFGILTTKTRKSQKCSHSYLSRCLRRLKDGVEVFSLEKRQQSVLVSCKACWEWSLRTHSTLRGDGVNTL